MTRAPYASRAEESRGRRFAEAPSRHRSAFQRDRDRILHSRAFRRLMHKTQVFGTCAGDHHRTRLTHSLEVAQIARTVARALALDEDLAEAIALAHDLGHAPFGHIGEDALDEALAGWGGFDHNVQTFRILTSLESRYAGFDGLNLTWETLEGVVKHNGPFTAEVPAAIRDYNLVHDLETESLPGPEAQAAALADDIAYHGHDLDDGLRMGLFTLGDLADVPVAAEAIRAVDERWPDAEHHRKVHETMRRIIDALVEDLIEASLGAFSRVRPLSADDVRWHVAPLIAFSPPAATACAALKDWLHGNMYCHERVWQQKRTAFRILSEVFAAYRDDPGHLPAAWRRRWESRDEEGRMRLVADYLAGMTDRFVRDEHRRLVCRRP